MIEVVRIMRTINEDDLINSGLLQKGETLKHSHKGEGNQLILEVESPEEPNIDVLVDLSQTFTR